MYIHIYVCVHVHLSIMCQWLTGGPSTPTSPGSPLPPGKPGSPLLPGTPGDPGPPLGP